MTFRIAAAVATLLAVLAGCGGAADGSGGGALSFESTAMQTVRSTSGALNVAVHAETGHGPARGVNAFRFVITDAGGAPVDGLLLTIIPWMPDMGHGSSVTPTVTAQGGGAYVISEVYFAMPGRWDLISNIAGPVTDAAKPSFQIQ
jgi:hypothetical protein